jgi:hypothetical protein
MVITARPVLCLLTLALKLLSAQNMSVVQVCSHWGSGLETTVIHYGQPVASAILKQVAVQLHWSCADKQAIQIQFVRETPRNIGKDTLAMALPHAKDCLRIIVFYERVGLFFDGDPKVSGRFLGHVLAHEIGHVLTDSAVHSKEGLMRAHWTRTDVQNMRVRLLTFDKRYEQFIRVSLARPMRVQQDESPKLAVGSPWMTLFVGPGPNLPENGFGFP